MKVQAGGFGLVFLLLFFSGSGPAGATGEMSYPNGDILVEAAWLERNLDAADLHIVDMRPAEEYGRGHVRGAVRLDLTAIRETRDGIKGMMARAETLESLLGGLGISLDSRVVIYDDRGGLDAARLFWTLEVLGHEKAALLNGGWAKWTREGRAVTRDHPKVSPSRFEARSDDAKLATGTWVLERLGNRQVAIIDARTPEEYRGEVARSARGGRIPGAVNIPWDKNLIEGEKVFKPAKALRRMYYMAGAREYKEVVVYCQTGHRAAHTYFALRLLGFPRVRLYDGSWEEWGNDPRFPIEAGPGEAHTTC